MSSRTHPTRAADLTSKVRPPEINAWPEGRRALTCLRCEAPFWSRSKEHRLCAACRGETETRSGGIRIG